MSRFELPLPEAPWLAEILTKRRSFEHSRWRKQFDSIDMHIQTLTEERNVSLAVADKAKSSYLKLFTDCTKALVLADAGFGLTAHSWADNVILFGRPAQLGRVYAEALSHIGEIDAKIVALRLQIESLAMEHVEKAASIDVDFFLEFSLDRYAA